MAVCSRYTEMSSTGPAELVSRAGTCTRASRSSGLAIERGTTGPCYPDMNSMARRHKYCFYSSFLSFLIRALRGIGLPLWWAEEYRRAMLLTANPQYPD